MNEESRKDRRRKRYIPESPQQWLVALGTVLAVLGGGAGAGGVIVPKLVDSGTIQRITNIEKSIEGQAGAISAFDKTIQERGTTFTRVEVRLDETVDRLKRVEEKIDRLFEMKRSAMVSD